MKIGISDYYLCNPYLGKEVVVDLFKNAKWLGYSFSRIIGMLWTDKNDLEKYSPWRSDLSCWNDEYWERLDFIVEQAEKYRIDLIFSIWTSQKTPLSQLLDDYVIKLKEKYGEDDNFILLNTLYDLYDYRLDSHPLLDKLEEYVEKLSKYKDQIKIWELINGAKDYHLLLIRFLSYLVRRYLSTSGTKILHSGEAPYTFEGYYDIYSPHSACGRLLEGKSLCNKSLPFDALEEEKEYILGLRERGKELIFSSDGCWFNEIEAEDTFREFKENWSVDTFEIDFWDAENEFYPDGSIKTIFHWDYAKKIIDAYEKVYGTVPKQSLK